MRSYRFTWAIAWLILLTIVLLIPGSTLPKNSLLAAIHADKWVHIALFGGLCFLFDRGITQTRQTSEWHNKRYLLISMGGIAYGTLMEFVQLYWVKNRSFETWDIAADGLGCLLAFLAARHYLMGQGGKKIGPDGNRDRNQN